MGLSDASDGFHLQQLSSPQCDLHSETVETDFWICLVWQHSPPFMLQGELKRGALQLRSQVEIKRSEKKCFITKPYIPYSHYR